MIAAIDPQVKVTSRVLPGVLSAQPRTFARNGFLFCADCAADAGYLIRAGNVRCFLLDSDGRETTTAILGPGHFVGIAAILGRQAHHEFCEALTRVQAWLVPAEQLRRCSSNPSLGAWLLGSIAHRFELALALRRGTTLLSAPERASDIQMRLHALSAVDPITVRQTTLAALLQIRPETLARARRPRHPPRGRTVGSASAACSVKAPRVFGKQTLVVDGMLPDGCIGRVISGHLELSLTASGSRAVVVEILGPGDLFSFGSLFGLPAVPFSAVGASEGAIDIVSGGEFLNQLATATNDIDQTVLRLTERLDAMDQELARATVPDVGARLVRLLRQVSTSDGVAGSDLPRMVPARWSHDALAKHLGVCRETVTRSLASLARAGIIRRQGRRILVSDADRPSGADGLLPHSHGAPGRLEVHAPRDRRRLVEALSCLRGVREAIDDAMLIDSLQGEIDRISGSLTEHRISRP